MAVKHNVIGVDAEYLLAIVADVEAHLQLMAGQRPDVQNQAQFDRVRRKVAMLNASQP